MNNLEFLYRGRDSKGQDCDGRIKASNRSAAEINLRNKGITVTFLKQLDTPMAAAPSPASASSVLPGPALPTDQNGDTLRLPVRLLVGLGLAVILLVGLLSLKYLKRPTGLTRLAAGETNQHIVIHGQLTVERRKKTSDPYHGVSLTLLNSEKKIQIHVDRRQLDLKATGDFSTPVDFLSVEPPKDFTVLIHCPGFHNKTLKGIGLRPDGSLNIPPVAFVAQARHRKPKPGNAIPVNAPEPSGASSDGDEDKEGD